MPRCGCIGPDYTPESISGDSQMLMNLYLEPNESGMGKSAGMLLCTPGKKLINNLANGQGRGITTAQGRTFAVIGTHLWEITAPLFGGADKDWTAATGQQIASDGQPVCMANGPTQLLIVSAGQMYLFDLNAQTLTIIPAFSSGTQTGLLGTPKQVRYDEGFFYALIYVQSNNTTLIQQSNALDGSTWQGVAETGVSVFPDNVTAIFEDHLTMWVFSNTKIQPYVNDGNFPFALDTIQGAIVEDGLAAVNSICKADNSIFWLGANERGQGIIRRANGYNSVRVSNFALEYELSTYKRIDDCVAYSYQEAGHEFVVFNFPTAGTTKVYDCATQTWARRGFWNEALGIFQQDRAGFHTFNKALNAHIVLDPSNGNVYQQSKAFLDDAGVPIRRIRRFPHLCDEQAWGFYLKFQLDLEVGLGPTLQGRDIPTVYNLQDAAGNIRAFGVTENGQLQAPIAPKPATPTTLFISDLVGNSYQATVDGNGIIDLAPVTFNPLYPQSLSMVTNLGQHRCVIQVANAGKPILQILNLSIVERGPIILLRKSNDGGHSWDNPVERDCGALGAYRKRVIWYRLGRARDRVFEISMSDPANYRIIDAYLHTDTDQEAMPRYARELAKRA